MYSRVKLLYNLCIVIGFSYEVPLPTMLNVQVYYSILVLFEEKMNNKSSSYYSNHN